MQTILAERVLTKIMNWSSEEVAKERPLLEALSGFKYNEYQQFSPGIRFIESLARWLDQFQSEERRTAYDFVTKNLIFISSDQIAHLVNIAFTERVHPHLIEKTSRQLSIEPHLVRKIVDSPEYSKNLRKSLFIGLSDGSRIDQFRRSTKNLNNEQVYPTYAISKGKAEEMIKDLGKAGYENEKFNSIFLIDDFTASGVSFFREAEGKGKILKFFNLLFPDKDKAKSPDQEGLDILIDKDDLDIHVIFYVATSDAIDALTQKIDSWKQQSNKTFNCTISTIQLLDKSHKEAIKGNSDFLALISKYFCSEIIDEHYTKGKHDEPYLGFNECSLPLVLYHNTPNNALPILWFPEDLKYVGLFPRVTRHKE